MQVGPDESIDDWSDARIWDALQTRLGVDGWDAAGGPDHREVDHADAQLRRLDDAHGRMFLAGDAGHIVPPTGAKGLNSAIADVAMLGRAILDHRARRLDRPRPLQRPGARAAVEGAALLAVDDRDAARAPRGPGCLGARLPLPQPGRPARVRHRLRARDARASPSSTPAFRSIGRDGRPCITDDAGTACASQTDPSDAGDDLRRDRRTPSGRDATRPPAAPCRASAARLRAVPLDGAAASDPRARARRPRGDRARLAGVRPHRRRGRGERPHDPARGRAARRAHHRDRPGARRRRTAGAQPARRDLAGERLRPLRAQARPAPRAARPELHGRRPGASPATTARTGSRRSSPARTRGRTTATRGGPRTSTSRSSASAFTQRLITQMYFPGDPLFALDPIYQSIVDPAARERLVARLRPRRERARVGARLPLGRRAHRPEVDLDGTGGRRPCLTDPRLERARAPTAVPRRRRRRRSARSSATRCPTPAAPTCAPPWHADAIRVHGTVFDGAGDPVPDAIIEIWGADAAGRPIDRTRRVRARPARVHGLRPRGGRPRRALLVHDDQARRDARRFGAVPARDGVRPRRAAPPLHPGVLRRRGRGERRGSAARERRPGRRDTLVAAADAPGRYRFDIRLQGDGETVFLDFGTEVDEDGRMTDWGLLDPGAADAAAPTTTPCSPRWSTSSAACCARGASVLDEPLEADRPTALDVERRSTPTRCVEGARAAACPVVPLVRAAARAGRGRTDGPADRLHLGATSQDILDTASCSSRSARSRAARASLVAAGASARCARRRGAATRPSIARTLGQHAEATTLGAHVAAWLDGGHESAIEASTRSPSRCSSAAPSAPGSRSTSGARRAPRLRARDWPPQLGLDDPGRVVAHRAHARAGHRNGRRCGRRRVSAASARDVAFLARDRDRRGRASPAAAARRPCRTSATPSTPCCSPRRRVEAPALVATLHRGGRDRGDDRPAGRWHAEWPACRSLLRLAARERGCRGRLVAGLTVEHDARRARSSGSAPGSCGRPRRGRGRRRRASSTPPSPDSTLVDGGRTMTVPRLTGSVAAAAPTAGADRAPRAAAVARHDHRALGRRRRGAASGAARACGSCASTSPATARARPRAIRSRSPSSPRACSRVVDEVGGDASTSPATRSAERSRSSSRSRHPPGSRASRWLASGARIGTADGWAERAASVRASGTASLVGGQRAALVRARLPRARARRTGRARAAPARRRRRRVLCALLRGARRVRSHRGGRRGSTVPVLLVAGEHDGVTTTERDARARRRRARCAARRARRRLAPRRRSTSPPRWPRSSPSTSVDGCRDGGSATVPRRPRRRDGCRDPRHGACAARCSATPTSTAPSPRPPPRPRRSRTSSPATRGARSGRAPTCRAASARSPRSRASSPAATRPRSRCTCARPGATASPRRDRRGAPAHRPLRRPAGGERRARASRARCSPSEPDARPTPRHPKRPDARGDRWIRPTRARPRPSPTFPTGRRSPSAGSACRACRSC